METKQKARQRERTSTVAMYAEHIDNDENKMINGTQFKSIIYLNVINGNRDK